MAVEIVVSQEPSEADRNAVLQPLVAYNITRAGAPRYEPLAIMLRDDAGTSVGGLWGRLHYDWLFIELLYVPDDLRGQNLGTGLLREAEAIARRMGCVGV